MCNCDSCHSLHGKIVVLTMDYTINTSVYLHITNDIGSEPLCVGETKMMGDCFNEYVEVVESIYTTIEGEEYV